MIKSYQLWRWKISQIEICREAWWPVPANRAPNGGDIDDGDGSSGAGDVHFV